MLRHLKFHIVNIWRILLRPVAAYPGIRSPGQRDITILIASADCEYDWQIRDVEWSGVLRW